jgi:hypothetical protein
MDKLFRIHCSQIWKIMGGAKNKSIPKNADEGLVNLIKLTNELQLSDTCITHLKEFYSGDKEDARSKYTDKGNEVESDNIDFMANVLGFGLADKNLITMSDEFMVGTCDVDLPSCVVDVKSPWDNKNLLDNIYGIDPNYEWQLRGYLRLYRKEKAILFYGLQNTPETDYSAEVSYDHLPEDKRWLAYTVTRDETLENMIVTRVLACREWLNKYHELVTSKLGKCH